MSSETLRLDDKLHNYWLANSLREPEVLAELRAETAGLPGAQMQIAPEQGQLLTTLVSLMGAKRAIEVGTFTGYSSIAIAMGLADGGKLVTCDVDERSTSLAKRFWSKAGLEEKIELKLGDALETLDQLEAAKADPYDFGFIDGDRPNYINYYEKLLQLIRPGGLIVVDNVFAARSVLAEPRDRRAQRMHDFNTHVFEDERVQLSVLPIADGVLMALKR